MNTGKLVLLFGLILGLGGCNIFHSPSQPATKWRSSIEDYRFFETDGRLSVSFDGKGYSAHFSWQKQPTIEVLDVNTPLGSTVGQICQDDQGVIATAKSEIYQADSVEDLSRQLMGFELPLTYLSYWVQGYAVPNQPFTIDANGNLQQMGWQIKRTVLTDQLLKPRRIELTRKEMDIRIVLDDFEFSTLEQQNSSVICHARNMS